MEYILIDGFNVLQHNGIEGSINSSTTLRLIYLSIYLLMNSLILRSINGNQ